MINEHTLTPAAFLSNQHAPLLVIDPEPESVLLRLAICFVFQCTLNRGHSGGESGHSK